MDAASGSAARGVTLLVFGRGVMNTQCVQEEGSGLSAWPLSARLTVYVALLATAHWLGYALRMPSEALTTFWPPAGVTIAILALEPRLLWPWHLAWFVALDVSTTLLVYGSEDPVGWALYFAAANALEALLAAMLLRRLGLLPIDCSRIENYATFVVTGSFGVPMISALLGALGVTYLSGAPFPSAWTQWWLGDALGILIVVPAIQSFLSGEIGLLPRSRPRPEALAFVSLFVLGSGLTCRALSPATAQLLHIQHLAIPFLIWAALRFNWRTVSTTLFATGALIVWEARAGDSPLLGLTPTGSQLVGSVQLYLVATGIPTMLLAALVASLRSERESLLREMAERAEVEQRRRELERALRGAQQAAVVGNLASGVAHDMNNMLMVLSGHTDILEELRGSDPVMQRSVSALREAVTHAAELTRSLATLARRADSERERVELGELVESTCSLIERAVPQGVELRFDRPAGAIELVGDRSQLRQMLLNLCLNAGDAMRDTGGTLGISLLRHAGEEGSAEPSCELRVSDQGCGIGEAARARIFEPFFTTKEGSGIGLGLAVVMSTVKDHGGRIEVRSTVGEGTVFSVTLPVLGAAEPLLEPGRVPHGHGEVVLVLREDDEQRERLSRALLRYGFECVGVRLGERVLELADAGVLHADALVLDVASRGISGLECLRRLRARGFDMPAVVVAREPSAVEGMTGKLGARLLSEPCSDLDVVRAVLESLNSSTELTRQG